MNDLILTTISNAARKQKTVSITYRDEKGNVTQRETEPYELKDGRYFGHTEKGIRGFKIDNIISAQETEHDFTPRWPIKI